MNDATPAGSQPPVGFSMAEAPNVSVDQSQQDIINQFNHHIQRLTEEFLLRSQDKDNQIADLKDELENAKEEREEIFEMNQKLERDVDDLKAKNALLEEKIKKFREEGGGAGGGGGGNAMNVLNQLDFPKETKVGTFERYMTQEVRIWNKEVHHRVQYPSDEDLNDRTLE